MPIEKLTGETMLIQQLVKPIRKILFLGYGQSETILIDRLLVANCEVWHSNDAINNFSEFDLVISFGYKHIIKKEVISQSLCPIVNLHISYLPWNRGAHPNFWSFFDGTPAGVSLHLIDERIDTGPILYQKKVNFNADEDTFFKTYQRLLSEVEMLFIKNINEIIDLSFSTTPQLSGGTFHRSSDLPASFRGWHSIINEEIDRLKNLGENA